MRRRQYTLNARTIGDHELFRPTQPVVEQIRDQLKNAALNSFSPGVYTSRKDINKLLHVLYRKSEELLEPALGDVASQSFITFALDQYDRASRIESQFKSATLNDEHTSLWRRLGPQTRRAIKFVCEASIRTGVLPIDFPTCISLNERLGRVWCLSEQMALWSELSDQTHYLFPDRTTVTLDPYSGENVLKLEVDQHSDAHFQRMGTARDRADYYIPSPPFEFDMDVHFETLDAAFLSEHSTTYKDIHSQLMMMLESVPSQTRGVDVQLLEKRQVLRRLASNLGIAMEKAHNLLNGFTTDKVRLDSENRELWKPSQEFRLFRRGMLQIHDGRRPQIVWSRSLAREALMSLTIGMCSQHAPREWRCPAIDRALSELARQYGRWFEKLVGDNAATLGIKGVVGRQSLGTSKAHLPFPESVGEIDFIGYWPAQQALVVLECKATWPGSQSRFFKNDLLEFVTGPQPHVSRFQEKVYWIRDNIHKVATALASEQCLSGVEPIAPKAINYAVVTRHPVYSGNEPNGVPIPCLVEFCDDVTHSCKWPYVDGSISIV